MNFDHHEALHAVRDLGLRLQPSDVGAVDVSVHPPFTDIRTVQAVIEPDGIPVALGAQNCAVEDSGAFTGEVSPLMLAKLHVEYVIVGHSERRHLFGETDESVAAKLRAVLRNGMTPICCVGETGDEREAGLTRDRLAAQVESALADLPVEFVAGDPAALAQRLGPRLALAPLTAPSLRLIGARLAPGSRATATLYLYENARGERVALMVEPLDEFVAIPARRGDADGLRVAAWTGAGYGFVAAAREDADVAALVAAAGANDEFLADAGAQRR